MNEPKRLLEETDSPLARELLNAGRWSPWPPGVRRQRVLTALGVGLAVGTTNKLSFAAMTTWSKVVAIGCVVGAGAGSIVAYQAYTRDASPGPASRQATEPVVATERASVPALADDPAEHLVEHSVEKRGFQAQNGATRGGDVQAPQLNESAAPEVKARSSVARANGAKNEGKDSKVRAELTLLEQARAELRAGRSLTAVSTLSTYGQRFPRGVLALEAEVLRIEALAAAGKTQEAAKRAQRVLERHPNSVVASRLKRFEAPR